MIISRTPFRISFLGGGTDYPAWYMEHGGSVLATTINKYCYLTCRYLPPFFEHRYRVVWSKIENCHTIDEITHPAVRAILNYMQFDRGVEIHHDGDLPARSGTGSSSAFAVGLLNAMHALEGRMVGKRDLAEQALHIEQDVLKENVGSQDQVMAAHGGLNKIDFHPGGQITVTPLALPRERVRELEDHMMLFYTGITRTASNIVESYIDTLDQKRRQLRVMADLVNEGFKTLNSNVDITEFGKLLHENWQVKRELGEKISNGHVDEIYAAAIDAGAIGGKLSGAGGGGFMNLFVPPSKQPNVIERLSQLVHVPFQFEPSGSQIIFFDPEEDYSAAELLRAKQNIMPFRDLDRRDAREGTA